MFGEGCKYFILDDFEQIVALLIFVISNMLIDNDSTNTGENISNFS